MKGKWSDAYNNMPYEFRVIASKSCIETQIRTIEIIKQKIKKHHRALIRDINTWQNSMKKEIEKD
jgi:hypothetical protein